MRKSILVMSMILGLSLSGKTEDNHKHDDNKTHSSHEEDHCKKDKLNKECKIQKEHKDDLKEKKKDLK